MRLHLKVCAFCNRCAIRIDGEKEWHRNMVNIPVAKLQQLHEIVSQIECACETCSIQVVHDLAVTAGACH